MRSMEEYVSRVCNHRSNISATGLHINAIIILGTLLEDTSLWPIRYIMQRTVCNTKITINMDMYPGKIHISVDDSYGRWIGTTDIYEPNYKPTIPNIDWPIA